MSYEKLTPGQKKYKEKIRLTYNELKQIRNSKQNGIYSRLCPNLWGLLQNDNEWMFICSFFNYALSRKGWVFKSKNSNEGLNFFKATFLLSTRYFARYNVGYKSITSVNNRLNYYACIGLWDKISYPQLKKRHTFAAGDSADAIRKIAKKINAYRNINIYQTHSLYRYNFEDESIRTRQNQLKLRQIEERIVELKKHGIKQTNCSYKRLFDNDLHDYIRRVYHSQTHTGRKTDYYVRDRILDVIRREVEANGYCRKSTVYRQVLLPGGLIKSNDIRRAFDMNNKKLDKCFGLFRCRIEKEFIHKSPSKQEREQYGIEGSQWCYFRRGTSGKRNQKSVNLDDRKEQRKVQADRSA